MRSFTAATTPRSWATRSVKPFRCRRASTSTATVSWPRQHPESRTSTGATSLGWATFYGATTCPIPRGPILIPATGSGSVSGVFPRARPVRSSERPRPLSTGSILPRSANSPPRSGRHLTRCTATLPSSGFPAERLSPTQRSQACHEFALNDLAEVVARQCAHPVELDRDFVGSEMGSADPVEFGVRDGRVLNHERNRNLTEAVIRHARDGDISDLGQQAKDLF